MLVSNVDQFKMFLLLFVDHFSRHSVVQKARFEKTKETSHHLPFCQNSILPQNSVIFLGNFCLENKSPLNYNTTYCSKPSLSHHLSFSVFPRISGHLACRWRTQANFFWGGLFLIIISYLFLIFLEEATVTSSMGKERDHYTVPLPWRAQLLILREPFCINRNSLGSAL